LITIEHPKEVDDLIVVRVSGTATKTDYEAAVPELENAVQLAKGPLSVLIRLENFQGWELEALWREIEFTLDKTGKLGRVAVLGETKLEEWGTKLSAAVAPTEMAYFPSDQEREALAWLRS